jgi:hypothetical protein
VEDNKGMLKIVVDYYKALFGAEDRLDINLADDFWDENDMVKDEHNTSLEADFFKKEVKEAVLALMLKVLLNLMVSFFFSIKSFGSWLSLI